MTPFARERLEYLREVFDATIEVIEEHADGGLLVRITNNDAAELALGGGPYTQEIPAGPQVLH